MTGDQIYADDVAGPMLAAIHQVIGLLGLYPERLEGATVADSEALLASALGYYRRQQLLPRTRSNKALRDRFFGGARKPIFTTAQAGNHLITMAEVAAMYLLIWSPAPVFGVKLIEAVQRVFTYFGHALLVDAENWMAHPGSANVMLNIFRHRSTPRHFVILSGDVHYSFVYDVKIRYRTNSPAIWQITATDAWSTAAPSAECASTPRGRPPRSACCWRRAARSAFWSRVEERARAETQRRREEKRRRWIDFDSVSSSLRL